jgi:hypothetical protein
LTKAIYADDYKSDLVNVLAKNDFQKFEAILKENANTMSIPDKRVVMTFTLTFSRGENTVKNLELLSKYNIHATAVDLYDAINKNHSNAVIQFILDDRIQPNGEILLLAAKKQRFDLVARFVEMGADVNYRYSTDKTYADGMTPLLYTCQWGNFETVKLLVEHDADVNLSAKDGSTALSIASETGQTLIWNYLKEHGAIEKINTVDNSAAQLKGATGISGLLNSQSSATTGISGVLNNRLAILQNGTYRLSGSTSEIKLNGSANAGNILYTNNGKPANGYFRTEGTVMTVVMEGRTFIYKIDSNISFSGNGETWVRTGN